MTQKEPVLTFEAAMERLEALISAMETGDIPLADMVSKFEEGSKLLKTCQAQLEEAELTIEKLDPETGSTESLDSTSSDEAP
jgi:exodeoxyribonuclease VII small subunit